MHDANEPTTHPVEVSRASSPTDMDVEASDDENAHSARTQASPPTPGPPAHHPPMVFAPTIERAPAAHAEDGKENTAVHPPMLPADIASEMAARKAELQVAAILEGTSSFLPLFMYNPTFPPRQLTSVRVFQTTLRHAAGGPTQ